MGGLEQAKYPYHGTAHDRKHDNRYASWEIVQESCMVFKHISSTDFAEIAKLLLNHHGSTPVFMDRVPGNIEKLPSGSNDGLYCVLRNPLKVPSKITTVSQLGTEV